MPLAIVFASGPVGVTLMLDGNATGREGMKAPARFH